MQKRMDILDSFREKDYISNLCVWRRILSEFIKRSGSGLQGQRYGGFFFNLKEMIRQMKCSAEIQEEQWNVNLTLPIEILEQVYGKLNLQEGSDFRCNFYKICETKEYEHYAAYRCVESEQPNFHLPEYFENAVILKRK